MNIETSSISNMTAIETESQHFPEGNNQDYYYKELARISEAGGWGVDFNEKRSYLDPLGREMLKVPQEYRPSLSNMMQFYPAESFGLVQACITDIMRGKKFDVRVKMKTYTDEEFWVQSSGSPIFDNSNNVIGVRGVFHNINESYMREKKLEESVKLIESQNSRLLNFAHIVSHNLRSHASNLQLTLELYSGENQLVNQQELLENFNSISGSLNESIDHLNKIVSIHDNPDRQIEDVCFNDTLTIVKGNLGQIIRGSNTTIHADFSELPKIKHINAYLESILQNFITNSIKYKQDTVDPVITIKTYKKRGNSYLSYEDNGSGIDMDKFGEKVFLMYKTFHGNPDATGIGLFITKNQIESLGGTIDVFSEVNKGTKFLIKF